MRPTPIHPILMCIPLLCRKMSCSLSWARDLGLQWRGSGIGERHGDLRDRAFRAFLSDDYDLRAGSGFPAVQTHRRMKHPLHAVDHDRARIVIRMNHALHPKQGLAMRVDDPAKPLDEDLPFYRPLLLDEPGRRRMRVMV